MKPIELTPEQKKDIERRRKGTLDRRQGERIKIHKPLKCRHLWKGPLV
jgi:hypothetical protein